MLRARLATAAVALPVVLAAIIFLSSAGFSVFIALLGGWGLYEVASMSATRGMISILVLLGLGVVPLLAMLATADGGWWVLPAVVTALMFALVVLVGISGPENAPKGAPLEIAGALWVGVLFPYFALLRNLAGGVAAIIMMLLVVIASDTGAYFGGRALGAHKLAPRVSPNKTIEGSVAGLMASIGAGLILHRWAIPHWSLPATAALCAVISVLAQVGDLAGSAFKRVAGVKDSGWIFPGHGGLLDRTCSLVFAAAFSYYCFR
jgi:phosphatidate cytidylyltransferase